MKIYEANYEFHSGLGPEHALRNECEYSQTEGAVEIFGKDCGLYGGKGYALNNKGNELTEVFAAHPLYILSSVGLILHASILLLTGFETNIFNLFILFDSIYRLLVPLIAVVVAFMPTLMINQQPDGFRTANYPENDFQDLQPVAFLTQVTFSKLVYLNYFAAGVIAHAEIFSDLHILSPIYFLGISGVILLHMNIHDPATNKTVFLSVLGLLPYGVTIMNILVYSQWEELISKVSVIWANGMQFTNKVIGEMTLLWLSELNPEQSRAIAYIAEIWMTNMRFGRGPLAEIAQAPLTGLIVVNVAVIYVLIRLKRSLGSPSDPFGMYTNPQTVTDKKYLRVGVSLILAVYIGFSLTIFVSQLIGYSLIPINQTASGLLIFWPLYIIIPVGIAVWYQRRNNRTTVTDISAERKRFEFNGISVVVKNTGDSEGPAFVRSNGGNTVIVIDSQLRDELSDDEIEAVCYHELYHIKYNSVRYQTRIEIPIVGYLLFFISTNLEELYNDEYRADEFAAHQSSEKTVTSALRKANSMSEPTYKSKLKAKMDQGWWEYAKLLCSPPILKLYSPSVENRIARLEGVTGDEGNQSSPDDHRYTEYS